MYFFYINDSSDPSFHTFSALGIPEKNLKMVQLAIKTYRTQLKHNAGIFISKELDASKFVSGKGHPSNRKLSKKRRCRLFNKALSFLARQKANDVILINTALDNQPLAFEHLLNEINSLMESLHGTAILFCDEIKIKEYARLIKKIGTTDPTTNSDELCSVTSNHAYDQILEDLIFKPAARSNFIQLAGFCAYALLRKERPIETKNELGIDTAFDLLAPICLK